MTESDESVPEAEVPEYLADAAEPEEEAPSVPRTGVGVSAKSVRA
jgi:hypothetical protein